MAPKRNTRTPEHYDVPIQPIAYILANNLTFPEGNVVKYITRHRFKGEDKDIYKIIRYAMYILRDEYAEEKENMQDEIREIIEGVYNYKDYKHEAIVDQQANE